MTKPVCCLFLALGLTACVQKAVVVENEPATGPGGKPPANKPAVTTTADEAPRLVNRESGMIMPDLTKRLPDRREMEPIAPGGTGSAGATATPPTPAPEKRGE